MKVRLTLDGTKAHIEVEDAYEGFMLYTALNYMRNTYLNEVLKGSYISPGDETYKDEENLLRQKRSLHAGKNIDDEVFYFEQLQTLTAMMYAMSVDHEGMDRQYQARAFFEESTSTHLPPQHM